MGNCHTLPAARPLPEPPKGRLLETAFARRRFEAHFLQKRRGHRTCAGAVSFFFLKKYLTRFFLLMKQSTSTGKPWKMTDHREEERSLVLASHWDDAAEPGGALRGHRPLPRLLPWSAREPGQTPCRTRGVGAGLTPAHSEPLLPALGKMHPGPREGPRPPERSDGNSRLVSPF